MLASTTDLLRAGWDAEVIHNLCRALASLPVQFYAVDAIIPCGWHGVTAHRAAERNACPRKRDCALPPAIGWRRIRHGYHCRFLNPQ